MAANTSFSLDLTKLVTTYRERADTAVREVMIRLGSNIILRSPVRTGHFRANWQLGVGSAPLEELQITDKTGENTIQALTAAIPAKAAGQVYYIRNNTKYGPVLELGHSAQAPTGVVGVAVLEFESIVAEMTGRVT